MFTTKQKYSFMKGKSLCEGFFLREDVVASVLVRNTVVLFLVLEGQDEFAALPGGSSEPGETPEETAVRESFEETSLSVNIEKYVALYNLIVLNRDGTEKCRFLHCLFLASTTDTSPQPGSEWQNWGATCRWIMLKDLRRYRGVWPLPEQVRGQISDGNLNLGNLGELKYQMR